ncbi:4983_t:CDS:1, partial [Dentiscutata heterogama]
WDWREIRIDGSFSIWNLRLDLKITYQNKITMPTLQQDYLQYLIVT